MPRKETARAVLDLHYPSEAAKVPIPLVPHFRRDILNVNHLTELAGVLAVHVIPIVESPSGIASDSLISLQEASRNRAEAWMSRMNSLSMGAGYWSSLYEEGQDPRGRLMEEILVAELLTRVTVGLLMAQGRLHGSALICRTASAVFNDHQEARRSALLQMVEMADAKNPGVRKLDRLRRTTEQWSDMLLGPMICLWNVRDLAFDGSRAKASGQTLLPHLLSPAASGLIAAGIRVAFPKTIIGVPSHAGFHRGFAGAVLRCLPEDLFERDGGMLPLRSVRASRFQPVPESSPPKFRKSAASPNLLQSSNTPPSKLSFSKLRRQRQKP